MATPAFATKSVPGGSQLTMALLYGPWEQEVRKKAVATEIDEKNFKQVDFNYRRIELGQHTKLFFLLLILEFLGAGEGEQKQKQKQKTKTKPNKKNATIHNHPWIGAHIYIQKYTWLLSIAFDIGS